MSYSMNVYLFPIAKTIKRATFARMVCHAQSLFSLAALCSCIIVYSVYTAIDTGFNNVFPLRAGMSVHLYV